MNTKTRERRRTIMARFVALVVVCMSLFLPGPRAAAAPQEMCSAQIAAAQALAAQIAAHNAAPHVFELPRQAAAYAAYNAEAAALEARKVQVQAALAACAAAMSALENASNSSLPLRPVPETTRVALENAIKNIPANYTPPPAPASGKAWRVPPTSEIKPVYDILRAGNPGNVGNVRLQGQPRPRVGDTDPAYANRTIPLNRAGNGPAVSPDHIIPLSEIVSMPGFHRLTPMNMYAVTRAPVNLQWMSSKANWSKSSRSVANMSGVDPAWQAAQVQLEIRTRQQLQDLITKLLASQV